MLLGELKPVAAALLLPPTGPLLVALLGLLWARRHRIAGTALAAAAILLTLALCFNPVALLLARTVLPQMQAVQPQALGDVQAIVVLGGGVDPQAPEYGAQQPKPSALMRMRYGAWLAHRTGKPLAFAGGQGWGAVGTTQEPEGRVAERVIQDDYGIALRWVDDRSRDTRENAAAMAAAMQPAGVRRIALVTDSWHMPRALHYFRAAGFDVVPAPTHFPSHFEGLQEWLPSADALVTSRQVLREWLALRAAGIPHGPD
jgi:uncharacterized SAM-binding protein YcdF (DUF218 family)